MFETIILSIVPIANGIHLFGIVFTFAIAVVVIVVVASLTTSSQKEWLMV
jgi:hypothetical protein